MKKRITGIIFIVAAIAAAVLIAYASTDDPAVSLEYLNDIFMPKVSEKINGALAPSFTVVNVEKGRRFIGEAGCEFILRGGGGNIKASVSGGISDTTIGDDLWEDAAVPANHLLIIARDDGRGFIASSDAILLVKGKYRIE
jgi:hypothetical protein